MIFGSKLTPKTGRPTIKERTLVKNVSLKKIKKKTTFSVQNLPQSPRKPKPKEKDEIY